MKANVLISFFCLLFMMQKTETKASSRDADSILHNIQGKIYNAFISDISKKTNTLQELKDQLTEIDKGKQNRTLIYWRSYLQFYSTILYSQTGKKAMAQEEVELGMELLNNVSNKSSEEFTLLARLESIALQFAGMNIMSLSKSMNDNIQRALQLEKNNLRANFVYGSIDYYTPVSFGGGKKAEQYLLNAIKLPSQNDHGKYEPTWGKDEAYEMLINLYLKNGEIDKAKFYFEEASTKYPRNFQIMALKEKVLK